MTNIYMATIPANYNIKFRTIRRYFQNTGVKEYVIGKETGQGGYEHYQIRFKSCKKLEEIRQNRLFNSAACSVDRADTWTDYERKDGHYISSEDTNEIRKVRFGKPTQKQLMIIRQLNTQNVRQIDVWYDPYGNIGKSWLANHLYERGLAYYCPPTIDTVKGIIQFIANGYNKQKYIIIDIPRSWKWSEQLYVAIESIKDGLIYDTRYKSTIRNIRGVKVLVLCNTPPKLNKLSADRWRINTP